MKDVSFLTLLLCNFFLQAQQAYFSSKPPSGVTIAKIGENVTFNWNITLESGETLFLISLEYSKTSVFEDSAVSIANRIKGMNVSISKAFYGKVNVQRNGALTLYNVTAEQRGFYKCKVLLEGQSKRLWDKAQLLVGLPPVIHSSIPSKMILREGDYMDITCKADGSPVPNVSWYKQMQYGWMKISERKLQIKNVKQSDSGNYKCSAENFMGNDEKAVKLEVFERAMVTSFFHNGPLDDAIYECEGLTFTCEARGNRPPVKNIYIYHEGRLVHRSINTDKAGGRTLSAGGRRTGHLRIARVRKEQEGKYYCVAENEHGLGYNKSINLKVYAAPSNCERKTTTKPTKSNRTRTTKLAMSSVSHTDTELTLPTAKTSEVEREKLGNYSGSGITRPSLLLFALWMLHLMLYIVFS